MSENGGKVKQAGVNKRHIFPVGNRSENRSITWDAMKFSLRSLLIAAAVGPAILASGFWLWNSRYGGIIQEIAVVAMAIFLAWLGEGFESRRDSALQQSASFSQQPFRPEQNDK